MFQNANIGKRLNFSFISIILIMVIITILSIIQLNSLKLENEKLINEQFKVVVSANNIIDNLNIVARSVRNLYIYTEEKENTRDFERIAEARKNIPEFLKVLDQYITDPEGKKQLEIMVDARKAYVVNLDAFLELIRQNNRDAAAALLKGEMRTTQNNYMEYLSKLIDSQTEQTENKGNLTRKNIIRLIYILIILLSVGIVISVILAIWISNSIKRPINQCVTAANEIAEGNTNISFKIEFNDETADLMHAMEKMGKNINLMYQDAMLLSEAAVQGRLKTRADASKHQGDFRAIVEGVNQTLDAVINPVNEAMDVMNRLANKDLTSRVKGNYKGDLDLFKNNINLAANNLEDALIQVEMAVEQITSAAGQISSGSQTLAEATGEQASSLEEISSSIEEINSLTANNASNSKQGLNLTDEAVKSVDEGNVSMGKMNEAMSSILKSSMETGKIIKTIDEIAFQTNLLALNAAVEAAHAGEAGKGFAVVAEEVKNLALRSAEAAKNTSNLIEGSTKNAEMGAKIVDQVSHSFVEIKEKFAKVKNIVNEIAASSEEQAQGIQQVNVAVQEMNKVTQQSAANAEESASAAEELNGQSSELQNMVSMFNLNRRSAGFHAQKKSYLNDRRQTKQLVNKKQERNYELKPEQIIPLEDLNDEDFEYFK